MVNRRNRRSKAAHGTLAAAARMLRQIGDATGITVYRWDAAQDLFQFDQFGFGPVGDGVSLRKQLQLIHPEDRPRVRSRLRRAVSGTKSGTFQFRANPQLGREQFLSATYLPVGPETLQIIVQDVTRAHRAEMALRDSEDHHRHAVALNPEVPWLADAQGNIIEFGPRWLELVDLTTTGTLGQGWASVLHPDDMTPTLKRWQVSIDTGTPLDLEYRLRLKGGEYRWMRARAAARRDAGGRVVGWYGTLEDIHDRKLTEAALRESESFARSVLEASSMAIEVLDVDGHLIFMNGPGVRIMEVDDAASIMGLPFDAFWPETAKARISDAIVRARLGETVRQTLFGPTAKGNARWWDISISPIYGENGEVARLLALSSDVTEAKRNEAEIAYLAHHDNLTGLPNRMQFQKRLEELLPDESAGKLAVLSIDLDDFKLVNDTMGHNAGDALLRSVASRLMTLTRRAELVARLGGDEFAALLRVEDEADAARLAEAILTSMTRPFSIEEESIGIGASIGIAVAPKDGRTAENLMHAADVALYRVKGQKGRDYRYFEPMMDEALRLRREMKRDLALALSRNEFHVVYQPQIDIDAKHLTGFEALLRWSSPKHGEVSPMVFIPLAEESGLIEPIGAFVLKQACADATKWPSTTTLAVNLSAVQFRNGAALRDVTSALEESGLAAGRLEIEITESVLLDENVEAVAMLEQFHRMGIRVALDDFGTGYSSLSYLRRFPFDKIKIDRSFITDLPRSEESAAIVRSIIGLGRSLRARVIAEGVETWEQLMMLHTEGCHEAQGYLFSHPLPQSRARTLARTGFGNQELPGVVRRKRA
ncbi:MAG: putative bifunctional diguanylate cyclase/phosphodiesterase [Devosia sp.]